MKNLKPIYVLPIAIVALLISTFTFVACEKELNNPSVPVVDGTMVSKKRPTGTSTTSTTNSTSRTSTTTTTTTTSTSTNLSTTTSTTSTTTTTTSATTAYTTTSTTTPLLLRVCVNKCIVYIWL